jgi:hypothetical protein
MIAPTVHLRAAALRWTPRIKSGAGSPPQAGEENGRQHFLSSPVYGGGVEPGVLPGETVGGHP